MEYFLNEPIYQELMEMLQAKQDAPETAGSAGQVLALALVDSELVPVWITPASGAVQDVQINGNSIVQDGVANIPVAASDTLGTVIVSSTFGIVMRSTGFAQIYYADSATIKNGGTANGPTYRPITPRLQHESTFYGLAKVAGIDMANSSNAVGMYTDEAKHAILNMLGIGLKRDRVAIASTTLNAGDQALVTIPALTGYVPVFSRLVFTSQSGAAHMLCTSGIMYQSNENRVRIFNESASQAATFEGSLQVYYMPTTAFEEVV